MTKTGVKHYDKLCDMPACMCVGCPVYIFLRGGLNTTDGLPYLMGTVQSIVDVVTGGVDVTITYDDTTAPASDPAFEMTFSPDEDPSVCDPDCAGECDWLTKVKRMMESSLNGGSFLLQYAIYDIDADVANGIFPVPRIPLDPGFRLTDVRLTCYEYDINTELTAQLKVGATVKAQYNAGNLAMQRQLTIVDADCLNDELPELHITGLLNTAYGLSAKGLVLHLQGIQVP